MKRYVLLLLLSTLALKISPSENPYKFDYKEWRINVMKYSELTLDNVIEYLKLMDIQHPEVVVRQFILETGWGKSYVCKKYHNLFGFMKYSQDLGKYVYFKYNHWTESIESYKRFQDKKYKGGCYYTFLNNVGYAEAPDYVEVLKTIKINV